MNARLVLGTMNFGQRTAEPEALRIMERAVAAGITRFDTANMYVDGRSEEIVGRFLRSNGAALEIATKCGLGRVNGRAEGLSRAAVLEACARSRERLGVATLGLYYLHAPDPRTPLEETLAALGTLYGERAFAAWGVSNYASWQVLEMLGRAAEFGLPAPRTSQVIHNLLVRQIEIEHLPFCRKYGLEVMTYNPLAGGALSGARTYAAAPPAGTRFENNPMYQKRYWHEESFRRVAAYADAARAAGLALLDLAYGFAFGAPGVGAVLVGPGSVEHLAAALAAHARELPPALHRELDALHVAVSGTDARYAR